MKTSKKLAKIQYKEKQLNDFYLPMQNTLHHSKVAWIEFQKTYTIEDIYLKINKNEDSEETEIWRGHMLSQFSVIHTELENILKKRNLVLVDSEINDTLDILYKHISQY